MHIRCPHCHNAIDVVEDDTLREVCCPSCGSAFNLIAGERSATLPLEARTLGHFELLEQIGFGHFGSVWKARDTELDRIVAVKIPRRDQLSEAEAEYFLREARAAAQLKHPNIVPVHEVGREGDTFYIVSDYVQGANLREWLSGQQLTPREAAGLCAKIADALHDAHVSGVIHRDLKPGNIMMDVGGEPHLMDFGLAKRETGEITMTREGHILGTPAYMPPEQARGEGHQADRRSDVYSLGVILYELLTGELPFRGEMRMLIVQILRDDPPGPRKLNSRIPRDLETICLKCLEKDPNRRYATAAELAEELRRFLDEKPIRARPVGLPGRAWRWCRRNPRIAILTAALLLALSGGLIGTTLGLVRAVEAKKLAETETKRADEKAKEVRGALYAARQQVAMNAWRENRVDVLREVIERQELDLRDFEWSYLNRLAQSPGRRWQESGQMVNGVAISPDDKTAITVGFDGKATAWDVATGQKKWDTGDGFRWSVNAAAFSPDGKAIALAGHLGQLQLWNIDGTRRATLTGHRAQVFGVAFSPDGKTLSSASADLTVRLWEMASGGSLGVLGGEVKEEKATPTPRAARQQAVAQTNPANSVGHTNMVWQTAWSPDGKRLASCSTDGSIKIWNFTDRTLLRTMVGHEGIVIAVAWSPDGRQIAGASRPLGGSSGGEIKLWNPDNGRVDSTFRHPTGGLHAIAFSPDGLYLVTGGQDRTVRVWRKDGRQVAEHRGFRDDVIGLAIGGGGRWAVAGTRAGEIIALDLQTVPGRTATTASDRARLAAAPDGRFAVFDGTVHWRDADTLAEITSWQPAAVPPAKEGDRIFTNSSNLIAFVLRPDGQAAHSGHLFRGPGAVVWRDAEGKVRHVLSGHTAQITTVAFLPGDRLASGDEAGEVRIWDGATGNAINIKPWDGPIRFAAATEQGGLWIGGATWAPGSKAGDFERATSPDGRLARIQDGSIAWETVTQSAPLAADLSPDGRTLVVGCQDGTLLWLDSHTGTESHPRTYATGAVLSLRYSPMGRRFAVGYADGAVRLFDADSGEEVLALDGHAGSAMSLAFSSDGRKLAVAGGLMMEGGSITVWDGRPAGPPPQLSAPDAAWAKARLEVASGSRENHFGPAIRDEFAMRRHLNRLAVLEPNELQWPRQLVALDQDALDFRSAAARLEGIVGRWPKEAPMWYDLGNARRELDEVTGAEAAFRQCITLDPDMAEAHCNLGLLLGREGRFPEAIECLSRGHELGTARKGGKPWTYPSAAWLARFKRLGDVAKEHGARKDFSEVPATDRSDLIEVLTLIKRPLAAVSLVDLKPDVSPGPVVIGAALRCGEGIGDAELLAAADRSAWRAKALAWLRLDYEAFRPLDPSERSRRCLGMRSHPLLCLAHGDRTAAWPAAEREAWQRFWADVDAAAEGR